MTVLFVVTLVSLVLAVVMSGVAWRVAREERARTTARVAALASDIQTAVAAAGGRRSEPALRAVPPATRDAVDLFTATPSAASSRSVVVVGVGLFAFATAAALAVVLTSGSRTASPAVPRSRAAESTRSIDAPRQPSPASLELTALGQQRDGDRLVVRGVVRNPSSTMTTALTAVVFAFDRDGGFITSARAALDTPQLVGGGDSTFTVVVPHAERVVRYRVSFRSDATIVPHLDKRHAS
jgi:type II secretory pathway pseudopilin PulG